MLTSRPQTIRVTNRTFDGLYIDVPCDGPIVEITPIPLGDLTLQIALSVRLHWQYSYGFATFSRLANARKTIPNFEEALRWCATQRMGVRLKCAEGKMNDRLAQRLRDWDEHHGTSAARHLLDPSMRFVSHQLIFKHRNHLPAFWLVWC